MNKADNLLLKARQLGFSDRQIAALTKSTEDEVWLVKWNEME